MANAKEVNGQTFFQGIDSAKAKFSWICVVFLRGMQYASTAD